MDPYLKLTADDIVLVTPLDDGGSVTSRIPSERAHAMISALTMMLRMSGEEPDPQHPWFKGLAIGGDDYGKLCQLLAEDAAEELMSFLRDMVDANEERRRAHAEAANEAARIAHGDGGAVNLRIGTNP